MFWLYSILLALGVTAFSPLLLLRDTQDGRYTRFLGERFGWLPPLRDPATPVPPGRDAIWIHAVSVGEALAVEKLAARLRARFPGRPLVVSVTTAAGRRVVERRINADRVFYFPLDFRFCVRRSLRAMRPGLVLIAETEIWPNFLREAAQHQVPVMFVNGRISGRSYARYRLIRRLLRPTLAAVSAFLMQTDTDAARVLDLGANPARVQVAGNLKFDLEPAARPELVEILRAQAQSAWIRQILVAGSTMEGEEEAVLEAYERLRAQRGARGAELLLILAPRHPQRFDAVARLVAAGGLPLVRRTRLPDEPLPAGGVLLLDSLGELASIYQIADAVFIGGSLTPHGGHNLLEPAYWGAPVVFGPHMHNFAAIAEQFLAAGAALRAASAQELANVWSRLLDDAGLRERIGQAGRAQLEAQRGATTRALDAIEAVLGTPLPAAH